MRKLLLLAVFGLSCLATGQELVRNGGFNQGSPEYGGIPPEWTAEPAGSSGWGYVNDDGVLEVDTLANAVVFTAGPGAGLLVQQIACQPDSDYVLRASLKANGCVPMVEVVTTDGKVLASLSGDADRHGFWKHFDCKFASGKNRELTVRLTGSVMAAAGKSGIDQVSVLPAAAPAALAAVTAETAKPFVAPGENIALNKPYTLSPRPTYSYCTDPDDKVQLTDGVYTEGYFWTQKSTVGWRKGMPIIVTIDLGQEEPISGVSWNTAAGVAGVTWPNGLHIYVSSDQKTWFYQGDLVALSMQERMPPPLGKYSVFRYATGELQTKGRWVQILLCQGPYAFCDEIEVYRGQDAWLAQAAGSAATESPKDHFWGQQLVNSVRKRLQSDLFAAEENLSSLPKATPGLAAAAARIPALKAGLRQLPAVDAANFTAILPLNAVHEAILSLNAVSLQAAGFTQPFLWRNNRWDNLSLTAIPPVAAAEVAPLRVEMMRGEVRGETVNVCNPTSAALDCTIAVEGLPAGAALQLCEVLPTDTKQLEPIAAALKPTELADGSLKLRVPAGCSRQVWLSFRRPTLADGVYRGRLKATAAGQPELSVAVTLRIAGQFPAAPTLHVGGWDYINGAANYYKAPGNLTDNLAMMRDMYVDSPWATSAVMPQGAAFDANGRLTNADKLNFTNWDAWVERWSGARQYCVFMSVGEKFHNEAMGTDRFNRMVGDYMNAWANYLKKTGMRPNQLVVLLLDEPHNNDQDRIIIAWAKAIRAANPGIVIFEDPTYSKPEAGMPEMYELCDVLCPNTPMMLNNGEPFKQFYVKQREAGRELWLYSCSGPAKLLDPVTYHRAQKWRAFEIGAKGSFYWALGCAGGQGDSWNAYTQPGTEYSPYFVSQTTVMDGKHSEAVREGVQDYEYLVMLQKRLAQLKKAGKDGAALAKAEQLLAEAPGRALASVLPGNLNWETPKDRSLMDQVRIEILHALAELQ
ncbi:MAG: hypothetical protein GX945_11060 [Lentisphaerae bacterium]|nr:hypothetical protein [Lentisphaerota bacterium]